ncbi:GNAT family N-acetyltransferase [Chitinimonas sp.]|uniref:GNAT family N-acetyltransferase n=1 Tax=Chitinimonas sp. TaxID=1934313 RepID=UPI002F92A57C
MKPASCPDLDLAGFALRPLLRSDAAGWYDYLKLEAVTRDTSWSLSGVQDLAPLFDAFESDAPGSSLRFAIVDTASGRLAGSVGFHTVSPLNRTAEIAYDLAPDYWGRGLATAACKAVSAWGLAEQGYVRVQATCLDTNEPSRQVLLRSGYELEGRLRSLRLVRGEPRDFWVFSRLSRPA